MKPISSMLAVSMTAILAGLLSGCATSQDAQHKEHHPDATSSQTPAPTSGSSGDAQMGMMDKQAMCDMHKKMMSAKTPEERRSMMDDRMKTMSPEMMQKHMQMMQEQCK